MTSNIDNSDEGNITFQETEVEVHALIQSVHEHVSNQSEHKNSAWLVKQTRRRREKKTESPNGAETEFRRKQEHTVLLFEGRRKGGGPKLRL